MIKRCKECGANLAMVGIRHRCIPGASQALADAKNRETNPVAKATKGKTGIGCGEAPRKTQQPPERVASRLGAGRTAQDAVPSSDAGRVAIQKRGRPKITEPRPWEVLKIPRRTYYRRKAEGTLPS